MVCLLRCAAPVSGVPATVRILVVSDLHSNIVAFDAVLEAVGSFDQLWCLGDIVGYGPRPNEVVARLMSLHSVAVAGNHDHAALGKIQMDDFNLNAQFAAEWTRNELTSETRAYLDGLPTIRVLGEFTLVHGSPRSHVWEYILSAAVADANFKHFDGQFCMIGHTHIPSVFALNSDGEPFAQRIDGDGDLPLTQPGWRFILNPGSVGQPRDDNPLASCLLIDTDQRTARWRRVSYDVAETQRQMRDAKLPARLVDRLAEGW